MKRRKKSCLRKINLIRYQKSSCKKPIRNLKAQSLKRIQNKRRLKVIIFQDISLPRKQRLKKKKVRVTLRRKTR